MKNNDDGNSKECSCRSNRPLCLNMFQLGHTWSLTADIFECFLQLHPNQLMSEGIWSHRFWHMTTSNKELPPGWLQYSARSHEERSASSFSQSSRKEEDLRCFVEEGSRYAQGASDWKPASWGGWMDSFMTRCDLIRTWKVVFCFVCRCLWEPGTWHTQSSWFLTEVWIWRSPLSPYMGHDIFGDSTATGATSGTGIATVGDLDLERFWATSPITTWRQGI